jgi:hypothetical protein
MARDEEEEQYQADIGSPRAVLCTVRAAVEDSGQVD